MKNKIISAMLVGMSATMAVPVTAVMAAEGEPAATEATAAEAAVTEEAPAEETPVEETQAEEAAPENEAEEVQEEEAVPQVDENGEVTEAAKDAATPADFREKLSTLSFSAEVFGKYADKLTAYATSDAVDKSNLYNCEMSVLDQAERYANGESGEAIKAIKYQIALEFEKVYGEDAFLPGRDIRKAILEDLGKAQDFTACTTIAEADQLYKDNEGIVTLPVDMIKKDDGDISVNPNPGEGENKPSTGGDGTGTGTEGETKPELDTYVSGIQDYEIKVGEDIDTSSISYNAEHISSVELDSSKVDNKTGQDILDRQQLYIAQTGYVKILKEYYSSLKFETDSQKKMADETLNATVDKISKATSIDAASKALEDAKAALKDIAEQKETTLDELKEAAKAEINDKAKVINDSTSITSDIKNAFILKIDSCTDAKAIESAKNSADAAFTDVVAVVGGDMASFVNLFKDLKGISPDGDTTAMIDVVINLGAPKDMKDGANRVEDVCIALANSAEQFIKYLNVCAGQEVKGNDLTFLKFAEFAIRLIRFESRTDFASGSTLSTASLITLSPSSPVSNINAPEKAFGAASLSESQFIAADARHPFKA